MITIIIIKKNGDLETKNVKKIDEDQIFKFCNYKNNKDFSRLHCYNVDSTLYEIYGKTNGKANYENKYELPPPIDEKLFFGSLIILKKVNGDYCDLTLEEWEKTYEHLFGGFEDIGNSEDDERSVDSEIYEDEDYTDEGYLKDGFVVDDDDELQEEEYLDYESDQ